MSAYVYKLWTYQIKRIIGFFGSLTLPCILYYNDFIFFLPSYLLQNGMNVQWDVLQLIFPLDFLSYHREALFWLNTKLWKVSSVLELDTFCQLKDEKKVPRRQVGWRFPAGERLEALCPDSWLCTLWQGLLGVDFQSYLLLSLCSGPKWNTIVWLLSLYLIFSPVI